MQISIIQAFLFGTLEGGFFHQQALALVTFAGAALLQHHCRQNGVFCRTAGEGSNPRWEKNQVVQISAGKAEAPFPPAR